MRSKTRTDQDGFWLSMGVLAMLFLILGLGFAVAFLLV